MSQGWGPPGGGQPPGGGYPPPGGGQPPGGGGYGPPGGGQPPGGGGYGPPGGGGAPPGGGGWGQPPGQGGPPPGFGGPPGGGGFGPGPGGFGMSQYEFSQVENQTIAKAALWAKVLAGVLIVEGVLSLGNNALGGIADIVMGVVTIQGATALTNVVNSQGRDVPLMVEALDKISNLFLIRLIFAGIAAAGILCLLIVALMAGAASL